jgi:hypothetical protein
MNQVSQRTTFDQAISDLEVSLNHIRDHIGQINTAWGGKTVGMPISNTNRPWPARRH